MTFFFLFFWFVFLFFVFCFFVGKKEYAIQQQQMKRSMHEGMSERVQVLANNDALVVGEELILLVACLEHFLVEGLAVVHREDVLVQLAQSLDVPVIDRAELDFQLGRHGGTMD